MSQEREHENDALVLDNQFWANFFNDIFDNSSGEKAVLMLEAREEKEKKRGRDKMKKEEIANDEKKEGGETLDHIWLERERRNKMKNMFSNLQSLLPQLPPKADKSVIIDETVNYIKTLQSTLQRLQKQKLEKLRGSSPSSMGDQVSSMNNNINSTNTNTSMASADASHLPVIIQTWTSSNVVLNICGNGAQFAIYATKKPGLFTSICGVLEKYHLEATSVNISSDADRCVYLIQARLTIGATDHFPEMITMEEIYIRAAGEIILLVTS